MICLNNRSADIQKHKSNYHTYGDFYTAEKGAFHCHLIKTTFYFFKILIVHKCNGR